MNPNMQEMIDRFYRGLVIGKLERYPVEGRAGVTLTKDFHPRNLFP
jgi:hypothetical protein